MYRFSILISILWFIGCAVPDTEPGGTSSGLYDPSGSNYVPAVGTPLSSSRITNNSLLLNHTNFSSAPLWISDARGYVTGTRGGEVIFCNADDSVVKTIGLQSRSPIVEILADTTHIVTVQLDGSLTGMTTDGIQKWQVQFGTTRCNSLLIGDTLLVVHDSIAAFYSVTDGKPLASMKLSLYPVSVVYSSLTSRYYLALSNNSNEGSDSVISFKSTGAVVSRQGFTGVRITSNLGIGTDEGKDVLYFGALGEFVTGGSVRRSFIYKYPTVAPNQTLSKQEVLYLVTNVSLSRELILSSGFRERDNELISGIDAFALNDLSKRWQRRFSQPLVNPIAVSSSNVYFTLSFQTTSETPAAAIFYTLELNDGRTAKEVALPGSRNGFVRGIPMPKDSDAFLLADAVEPVLYLVTP